MPAAEVRCAAIVWRDGKTRSRASKGQIVDLPDDVYKRFLDKGDIQPPGSAPLPGSKVEATPYSTPFDDGSGTVSIDAEGAATAQPEPPAAEPAPAEQPSNNPTVDAFIERIETENLNAGDTVALAEGDPEKARFVLAAEHGSEGEARKGVVADLEKIIGGN